MLSGNSVRQTESRVAYAYLTMVVIMAGVNNVVGKFLVKDLPPFTVGAIRTFLGSVVLVFFLLQQEGFVLPQRRDWPVLFSLGLLGIFGCNAFLYLAVQHTSVTNIGLIAAGSPIMITVLSAFMLKERISLRQLTGIILSFLGVVVVITKGSWSALVSQGLNVGDLIMLGNPICFALYVIFTNKLVDRYSPIVLVTYAHLVGVMSFVPFVIYELSTERTGIHVTATIVGAFAYLGLFSSSIGTLWWNKGIAKVGANRAGIFINGIPIATMLISAIWLREEIAFPQILGAILVILGVYLNSIRSRAKESYA